MNISAHTQTMQKAQKRQQKFLIGTLFVLLLISICLLVILVWSSSTAEKTERAPAQFGPIEVQDRAALQGNTETVIPQSADGIHGVIKGFEGITTHMRFDIPATDLDEFMLSTGCSDALANADIREQFQGNPQKAWWALEEAQTYASCNGDTEHLAQLVFVDMTDPQRYVVYVFASTR